MLQYCGLGWIFLFLFEALQIGYFQNYGFVCKGMVLPMAGGEFDQTGTKDNFQDHSAFSLI